MTLREYDDLSTCFVLFHQTMRLHDFRKVKGLANLNVQGARRDLIH